jgi:hypothetical protein
MHYLRHQDITQYKPTSQVSLTKRTSAHATYTTECACVGLVYKIHIVLAKNEKC